LLLFLQKPELTVVQVSSNTAKVFSLVPEEVLHKRLEEFLDPFPVKKIRVGLAESVS
jgi:chemotaxis family two-component system sensor kinase Cph1